MRTPFVWAVVGSVLFSTAGLLPTSTYADDVRKSEWHLRYLHVEDAHRITKGMGVTVAVVDSGVMQHVDLEKNVLSGEDLSSERRRDGRTDDNGHGTQIAGIIAGHGHDQSSGILGIAPSSKILPIRVSRDGSATSAQVASGFNYAAKGGASIINFSGATAPSTALLAAVDGAIDGNVLIVAASGNRSQDVTGAYPAAIPGVLSVGAIDRSGKIANFSIPGPNVQICAPGVSITTTSRTGGYFELSGTSPATAIVSGAAALVRAKFPQLSAPEVIHRLTATATDIGKPGRDDECGYGVLNIVKALTADVPPLTPSAQPSVGPSGPAMTSGAPTPRAEPRPREENRSGPLIAAGAAILAAGILAGALTLRSRHRKR